MRHITVVLIIVLAAAVLATAQEHILTEGGNCVNTEASDRLTVESGGAPGDCLVAGPSCPNTLITLGAGC